MEATEDLVVKVRLEFDPPIEEVRRLSLGPDQALAVFMAPDVPATPELSRIVQRLVGERLGVPVLVLEHGMDLAVVDLPANLLDAALAERRPWPCILEPECAPGCCREPNACRP